MKIIYITLAICSLPNIAVAQPSILSALEAKGFKVQVLSDQQLSNIKGTARIVGQPHPSVLQGMKSYNLKIKRFGNEHDYRSYYSVGRDWNPHKEYFHYENGIEYKVAGDKWLVDKISGPDVWQLSNAELVDYHYQALNDNGTPRNFGWRETSWNRPISTFSW